MASLERPFSVEHLWPWCSIPNNLTGHQPLLYFVYNRSYSGLWFATNKWQWSRIHHLEWVSHTHRKRWDGIESLITVINAHLTGTRWTTESDIIHTRIPPHPCPSSYYLYNYHILNQLTCGTKQSVWWTANIYTHQHSQTGSLYTQTWIHAPDDQTIPGVLLLKTISVIDPHSKYIKAKLVEMIVLGITQRWKHMTSIYHMVHAMLLLLTLVQWYV